MGVRPRHRTREANRSGSRHIRSNPGVTDRLGGLKIGYIWHNGGFSILADFGSFSRFFTDFGGFWRFLEVVRGFWRFFDILNLSSQDMYLGVLYDVYLGVLLHLYMI